MIAEAFLIAVLTSLPALDRQWTSLCSTTSEYKMFVLGCITAQFAGYFLGIFPYLALDLLRPSLFSRRKIQPQRYSTAADRRRALGNILSTLLFVMSPLIALGGRYISFAGISRAGPLPTPPVLFLHLAFFLVVEDFLNYWLHRWLHTPWMYRHVHSVHHEFTAPFALMAAYAHPVEVVVLALPTFAGPALIAPHMFTVLVWQLLRNYEAIDIHSGYEAPLSAKALFPAYAGADHHDYHHYMHSGNFASVFVWCDRLYGTDLGYSSFKQKQSKPVEKVT